MFGLGKIISGAVRIATCPIDIAESVLDAATGGDGSKASKKSSGVPLLSDLRDAALEPIEDLDD